MANDKQKYQTKKGNNILYIIGAIAIAAVIAIGGYLSSGQGGNNTSLAGPAPSGTNCPENVAYIQTGVNTYKENVGQFPTELNQLLEIVDGKGPFVEKLPECPSGNIYVIDNGIVKEAAPNK